MSELKLQLLYAGAVYKDMDSSGVPVAKSQAVYIAAAVDGEIERLTRDEQEACAAKDAAYKLCDQYTAEIYCLRKALELFMLYHSDTKYATAELHLRAVAAGSEALQEPKP